MHTVPQVDIHILALDGELDSSNSDGVRAEFERLLAPTCQAVVDLTSVRFIDSSGLGALIGGIRRLREVGGDVTLAGARPSVARVLRMTGVDRLVALVDTEAEAAELIEARAR